jgi:hypothetical protein
MIFTEVYFERVIVDIVLLLSVLVPAVADVTTFVLVSTMCIQFVVSIEALSTKPAFRVSLETALVDRTGIVITKLLMLLQVGPCEKLVFVGEDFLISCAEIADLC